MKTFINPLFLALVLYWGIFNGAMVYALPANPNASLSAQKILAYLEDLPNQTEKRVISGERGADGGGTLDSLHTATGYWPGMFSLDYGTYACSTPVANQRFLEYWRKGGLLTATCHMNNPVSGGYSWDVSSVNVSQLLTNGTPENIRYRIILDTIASGLSVLQDSGVVVLWRPFHEMNGTWFWWHQNASDYITLWKDMFHYFTTVKQLNNLLWIYSVNADIGNYTTYYPGASYVDLVGLDWYYSATPSSKAGGYDELVALNKPFGITEFGSGSGAAAESGYDMMRFLTAVKSQMPKTTWFGVWWSGWAIEKQVNGVALLSDSWIANCPDIRWKDFVPAVQTPLIVPTGGVFTDSTVVVSMSCPTTDAAIHYTLDGTTPTNVSTLYTNPFVLSQSSVVKAMASKEGMRQSATTSASFQLSSPIIVDELNDFSKILVHSPNLQFDKSNRTYFGGDSCRLTRKSATLEYVVYGADRRIESFSIDVYFWPYESITNMAFYTAGPDTLFQPFNPSITTITGEWTKVQYASSALPAHTRFIKMEYRHTSANSWNPQISKVSIQKEVLHTTTVPSQENGLACASWVCTNAPNPFNPVTNIRFDVPTSAPCLYSIYNNQGRLVKSFDLSKGAKTLTWNATDASGQGVSSGTYIGKLTTKNGQTVIHRLVLVR